MLRGRFWEVLDVPLQMLSQNVSRWKGDGFHPRQESLKLAALSHPQTLLREES